MGPKGKSRAQKQKNKFIGIRSHNEKVGRSIDTKIEKQSQNIERKTWN